MQIECTKRFDKNCDIFIDGRDRQVPNAICFPCKTYRAKIRYAMLPKYKKKRIKVRQRELKRLKNNATIKI